MIIPHSVINHMVCLPLAFRIRLAATDKRNRYACCINVCCSDSGVLLIDADNQTSLSAASTVTGTGEFFMTDEVVMVYEEREGEESEPVYNREGDVTPQCELDGYTP